MDNKECCDCVFYCEGLRHVAECRRFPPHVLENDDEKLATVFPEPEPYYWCGEFISKLENKDDR